MSVWLTDNNPAVTFIRPDGTSLEAKAGAVTIRPGGRSLQVGLVIDARRVKPGANLLQSVRIHTDAGVAGAPIGSVNDGETGSVPGWNSGKPSTSEIDGCGWNLRCHFNNLVGNLPGSGSLGLSGSAGSNGPLLFVNEVVSVLRGPSERIQTWTQEHPWATKIFVAATVSLFFGTGSSASDDGGDSNGSSNDSGGGIGDLRDTVTRGLTVAASLSPLTHIAAAVSNRKSDSSNDSSDDSKDKTNNLIDTTARYLDPDDDGNLAEITDINGDGTNLIEYHKEQLNKRINGLPHADIDGDGKTPVEELHDDFTGPIRLNSDGRPFVEEFTDDVYPVPELMNQVNKRVNDLSHTDIDGDGKNPEKEITKNEVNTVVEFIKGELPYPNPPVPRDPGFSTILNVVKTLSDHDVDGDGEVAYEEFDDPWECGHYHCSDSEDTPGYDVPSVETKSGRWECGPHGVCRKTPSNEKRIATSNEEQTQRDSYCSNRESALDRHGLGWLIEMTGLEERYKTETGTIECV